MKNVNFLVILFAIVFTSMLCIPNDARADSSKDSHSQRDFNGFGDNWHQSKDRHSQGDFKKSGGNWHNFKENHCSRHSTAPEPISMILFLLGGMPLAASLYQKNKV